MAATLPHHVPVIVITDLARNSDDGVALMMLLQSDAVDVKGIIATAGNVCAAEAAKETRQLLTALQRDTLPVVPGPPMSWHEGRRRYYQDVEKYSAHVPTYAGAFGENANCAADDENTSADTPDLAADRAADFLIDVALKSAGHLIVILQGPATVLAQALKKEPNLSKLLARVYAMGGSLHVPGNATPFAEFNVWFDPEAMASLVRSGVAMTLVTLDATNPVTYGSLGSERSERSDPIGRYLSEYLEFRQARHREVPMWDEVLATIVIDQSVIARTIERPLAVSIRRDQEYGRLLELPADTVQGPVTVVTQVNGDLVKLVLSDLLLGQR